MKKIAVRAATGDDLDAAAAIAAARSAAGWTRRALAGELGRADAVFVVAAEGADVRGYAAARLVGEEARLLDVAVAADGRGVGRSLWAFLVAEARRRGAQLLTLEVSERNGRARAFYRAAGAAEVGRRSRFYADGSDAVLMDLRLDDRRSFL